MTHTVGPMRPYVASHPNSPAEKAKARLTCAQAALEQPCPHADLVLLLDALDLWEDE